MTADRTTEDASMTADRTTDPQLRSWVEGAEGSDFPVQHLPFGVFSTADAGPRVGVAIGDAVCDLAALGRAGLLKGIVPEPAALFDTDRLNPFLAEGRPVWRAVRERVSDLLRTDGAERAPESVLVARDEVRLHLPFEVADFVDFYSSLDHATNVGRMLRPGSDPLLPNWRHLPVGYHGRAGTIVPSGTAIARPHGQRQPPRPGDPPSFGPTARLDVELEVGFVTGPPSRLGAPVPTSRAADHAFGVVLVNDWSARDIQAWEYEPLGPFLGKSFATSIACWVTPLAALEPFRVPSPRQAPEPLAYLKVEGDWGLDLDLAIGLRSAGMALRGDDFDVVSSTSFARMYWTLPQQLAHTTVNGAMVRTGDLYASGTVSGPDRGSEGSLMELTRNGDEPLTLSDGSRRVFLEDGDEVVLSGTAGGRGRPRLGLGPVRGRVVPG